MDTIKIRVSKQMDGYTFWILPNVRQLIKSWSPNFRPANAISVEYDLKSGFEHYYDKLESNIYSLLLGIDNPSDLIDRISEIQFIDTKTETVMHTHRVTA
jgi:hypothetical protein